MQRMPSPFETRTQALQSAAGGGTTCTSCCSCCVATLAASVLIPYAVFNTALVRSPAASGLPLDAAPPAADADAFTSQPASTVDTVQLSETPGSSADGLNTGANLPSRTEADAEPGSRAGISKSQAWAYSWAVMGMSVLSLVIIGVLGVALQIGGLLIGAALALLLILGVFSKAYQKAGRTTGEGVAVGVGVVLLLGVVLAVEVTIWFSMIFR